MITETLPTVDVAGQPESAPIALYREGPAPPIRSAEDYVAVAEGLQLNKGWQARVKAFWQWMQVARWHNYVFGEGPAPCLAQ